MSIAFYDATLERDWNLPQVDRSFDKEKVCKYLAMFVDTEKLFVSRVIENTLYVNHKQFIEALDVSFEKFSQEIGDEPFYILLPEGKFGSENWIIALIWSKLSKLSVKGFIGINTKVPEKSHVVVIDDAMYSGQKTTGVIDEYVYNTESVITVHLLIPFVTEQSLSCVSVVTNGFLSHHARLVPSSKSLVDPVLIEQNYIKFGIEIEGVPLLYFDHKCAGAFSTYCTIYNGFVPGQGEFQHLFKVKPSREKIEELETFYQDFIINEMENWF